MIFKLAFQPLPLSGAVRKTSNPIQEKYPVEAVKAFGGNAIWAMNGKLPSIQGYFLIAVAHTAQTIK
jgi:hypothetical protein